jgi:hypothetical protein
MAQLVLSELVTSARTYAPGTRLLNPEADEGAVKASVWDSSTTLPEVPARASDRVGQLVLEIVGGPPELLHSPGTGGGMHYRDLRTRLTPLRETGPATSCDRPGKELAASGPRFPEQTFMHVLSPRPLPLP